MTILHSYKPVKNGDKNEILTYATDTTKPVCWVEGHYYKFASVLINRVVMDVIRLTVARRDSLCNKAPICPKCRTNQVQLIDPVMLAKWKCRECKHNWIYEPLKKG